MKRQRLEKEQESFQEEWNIRHEKLAQLRTALAIKTDTSIKFELKKEIQNEEEEIKKLEKKLEETEQSLKIVSVLDPQDPTSPIFTESSKAVDYRKLQDFLDTGKWREANKETWEVMLIATNRERKGWIDSDSFKKFPCKEIQAIDRRWINASEGQFGFSVQMKIWKECGCPMRYNDDWRKFLDRIGWCHEGEYNPHPKFNLDISPLGELPLSIDVASYRAWDASGQRQWDGISFFQRLLNCSKF
jgi:GUN4-like